MDRETMHATKNTWRSGYLLDSTNLPLMYSGTFGAATQGYSVRDAQIWDESKRVGKKPCRIENIRILSLAAMHADLTRCGGREAPGESCRVQSYLRVVFQDG
jgi:hypothetical protein